MEKKTEGIEVRQMWEGGPMREFAEKRPHEHWGMPYESPVMKGYAGSYVCAKCKEVTVGVYRDKKSGGWTCAGCRT
jgi:hypothetical protein